MDNQAAAPKVGKEDFDLVAFHFRKGTVPLAPGSFAAACHEQLSVEELRAAHAQREADIADCEAWNLRPREWHAQIEKALARKLYDLNDGELPGRVAPVGRPAKLDQGKRVSVYLDPVSLALAREQGDGNASEGIRRALAKAAG